MSLDVVLIGGPDLLVTTKSGDRFIKTANRQLFRAGALEEIAHLFEGMTCFKGHASPRKPRSSRRPVEGVWRTAASVGYVTHVGGPDLRVGTVVSPVWNDDACQIEAVLHPEPYWADKLPGDWALSVHIGGHRYCWSKGWQVITRVGVLLGLDLVKFGAAGGRFIVHPPN